MRTWEINPEILKPPLIDIGAGKGPINFPNARLWDKEDGDATYMTGVPDESYQTVYSHHCLEHLDQPIVAIKNWWRILKRGGFLIVTVPSRKYYEKRERLPSIFNPDHRTIWSLDGFDPPYPANTQSLLQTIRNAVGNTGELFSLRLCLDEYVELPQSVQSPDGFHLEIAMKKL